jgi:hypothetical protein
MPVQEKLRKLCHYSQNCSNVIASPEGAKQSQKDYLMVDRDYFVPR